MAKLYDKNGKEYNVPHAVDVKEWMATGKFFEHNPKVIKKEAVKVQDSQKNLLDKE